MISALLSHEKMKRDDENSVEGIVVAKPKPGRGRSKSRGRSPTKEDQFKPRGKKDVECNCCHKFGYLSRTTKASGREEE